MEHFVDYTESVQADFSIECGADDECLEIPWASEDSSLAYLDLKRNPDLIQQLTEVRQYPELGEFLRSANSAESPFQTAKCDAWFTTEIAPEEEIYGASGKFGSYVDVVSESSDARVSLTAHESVVKNLAGLLKGEPEMLASVEFLVRRCFFHNRGEQDGFYITCYVFGYGNDEDEARRNWGFALRQVGKVFCSERDSSPSQRTLRVRNDKNR